MSGRRVVLSRGRGGGARGGGARGGRGGRGGRGPVTLNTRFSAVETAAKKRLAAQLLVKEQARQKVIARSRRLAVPAQPARGRGRGARGRGRGRGRGAVPAKVGTRVIMPKAKAKAKAMGKGKGKAAAKPKKAARGGRADAPPPDKAALDAEMDAYMKDAL